MSEALAIIIAACTINGSQKSLSLIQTVQKICVTDAINCVIEKEPKTNLLDVELSKVSHCLKTN